MQRTSFDKRLTQTLSFMVFLALMVGTSALAVNWFLSSTHRRFVEANLPILDTANEIDLAAQIISERSRDLILADRLDDLQRHESDLQIAMGTVRAKLAALPPDLAGSWSGARAAQISDIVGQLVQNRRRYIDLRNERAVLLQRVDQIGDRLSQVVTAELELARLRVTSQIVGLYTGQGSSQREALDRLADQYFFAFERLTEMEQTVNALRLSVQRLPDLATQPDVAAFETGFAAAIGDIETRQTFLPTQKARQEIGDLIAQLRLAVASSRGLAARQKSLLTLSLASQQANNMLENRVFDLSDDIGEIRNNVQQASIASLARADALSARLFVVLLVIVVIASLASIVLWVRVRRQLLRRLGDVSRRIISVAQGDYGAPVAISGHDEIGRLEKALNVLRRRAQDAETLRTQLEEQVIARTGDVVAQMKASDEARDTAERASASKTEFLARMSHEIRTPLSGMIGMLDLLRLDVTKTSQRARVETALASARELLDITNDILDFASSDDPVNRGNPVHFRLRDLVGQLGHQLIPLATQKDLDGEIELVEPAPAVLFGDVVKIRQIVGNLISNAVKYTQTGRVCLTVESAIDPENNCPVVSFSVADTGIGMTQEAVAHAFEAYKRTDSVRRSGAQGTGLGLAISRNLTEALGGSLHVESAPDVGSNFTLTVPLALGDPVQIDKEETVPAPVTRGQSVLVIDDHATNRMVARGYLQRLGCEVVEAGDGQSALAVLESKSVDYALIDFDLPDMTGKALAFAIAEAQPGITRILLTAHHIEDTDAHREDFGVARILSKPVSPRALSDILSGSSQGAQETPGTSGPEVSLRQDIEEIGSETTGQILGEFLSGLDGAVEGIKAAPQAERARLAHRLKGAASNFALTELCAHLADIEKTTPAASDQLLETLTEKADQAASQLRRAAHKLDMSIDRGSTNR
ncbi:MAG: ATP-binding protein [Pseudomonadota bacterium]